MDRLLRIGFFLMSAMALTTAHALAFQTGSQSADVHDTSPQTLGSIPPSHKKTKGVTKEHPVKPSNYPKVTGPAGPSHPHPNTVQRKTNRRFGQRSTSTISQLGIPASGARTIGNSFVSGGAMDADGGAPALGGFEGLGDNGTDDRGYAVDAAPSDTNGAVGPKHFVEWVNESLIIFQKDNGAVVAGPIPGNAIWKNFGRSANGDLHACEKDNDGDPIVQYDKLGHRWILSQFSVDEDPNFYECVAVSTSDDPTGTYYRYAFRYDKFNDYPKLAVWDDAYYVTFNMFDGNVQASTKVCALDKRKMMTGDDAQMICEDLPIQGGVGGLLAADLDGPPAPSHSPEYLLNLGFNELQLWRMQVNWQAGTAALTGPTHVAIEPYKPACEGINGGSCVPQPKSAPALEALGDRLMYRLQYRHFQDHDSLIVNHSVTIPGSSPNQTLVGVRWYEIRDLDAPHPKVFQQSTYAPDNNFRWMGTIASDKNGNLLLGYSVSGEQTFPSIRFAGRFASDPPNELSSEEKVTDGGGTQVAGDRWGDYASISVDPVDDCTMWFAGQYQKKDGSKNAYNWRTLIEHVRFPGCQ